MQGLKGRPLCDTLACVSVLVLCNAGLGMLSLGRAMAAGYDMEDAMILNKSAVERGLAHATMIKTETVDLSKESGAPHAWAGCVESMQHLLTCLPHVFLIVAH